jgi:hypothetical protein
MCLVDSSIAATKLLLAMSCSLPTCLGDSGGGSCSRDRGGRRSSGSFTIDFSLRAVTRDMASLAASIARFPGSVERTSVGSSAVAGDVA